MKKSFVFAFLLTVFAVINVNAQKAMNEGTIIYDISVSSANNSKSVAALDGATLNVYLKDNQSRGDMISKLGKESGVYNSSTGIGFILKDYSGQKLMITMNKKNWEQKSNFYNSLKFKVEEYNGTVSGYKVKKATATLASGKIFTVYFTTDITLGNKTYNNSFPQLNGLPVQYELESGDITFKYVLKSVSSEPVNATFFEMPKADYRVMTYEESQQLKTGIPKK
ncbi:MAG: hypothetical protein ABIP68_06440 [Ferruginibacter sp.]